MPGQRVAFERILCPTDFSPFSGRALERAAALARWFDAQLTALHVIPLDSPAVLLAGAAGGGYAAIPDDLLREQRREAMAALRGAVAGARAPGLKIVTAMLEGAPDLQIEAMARALPADLLVMGTHGRSGWDRLALGSTTERVMRRVSCPVLAIGPSDRPAAGPLFHRIVCAADLTRASEHTLDLALAFAQESLAHVTLLHVIEGRLGQPSPQLHGWVADPGPSSADAVEMAHQQLREAGRTARQFCEVDERVEAGSAWREIVRVAGETAADLIVVGAHVTGGMGRFFLGSTANQVVRHAPCPVLVAREQRPADEAAVAKRGPARATEDQAAVR